MMARRCAVGAASSHDAVARRIDAGGGGLRATTQRRPQRRAAMRSTRLPHYGFQPQNEILRLLGGGHGSTRVRPSRCERPSDGDLRAGRLRARRLLRPWRRASGAWRGRASPELRRRRAGTRGGSLRRGDRRAPDRHRRFQRALWRSTPRAGLLADRPRRRHVLCRCEEITFGQSRPRWPRGRPSARSSGPRASAWGAARAATARPCAAGSWPRPWARPRGPVFFAPRVPIKPVSIARVLAAEIALDERR